MIKEKIWSPGVLHLDKYPWSLGQLMSNSFNWHCTPSTIYNDLCSLPWLQEMRWLPPEQLRTPASIHCVLPSDRSEFISRPAGRCDLEQSTHPWGKFHSSEKRGQNAQFATLLWEQDKTINLCKTVDTVLNRQQASINPSPFLLV